MTFIMIELQTILADAASFFHSMISVGFVLFGLPSLIFAGYSQIRYFQKKEAVTKKSFNLLEDIRFIILSSSIANHDDTLFYNKMLDKSAAAFTTTPSDKESLNKCERIYLKIKEYLAELESRKVN